MLRSKAGHGNCRKLDMKHEHLDRSPPSNPARRRFTRGGLAAPVVLGTLASKPILGQAGGLQCSVTGNQSGNTSVRGAQLACSASGVGPASWLASQSWPAPLTRGLLTNNNPDIQAASGTVFDGFILQGATNSFTMSALFSQTATVSASSTTLNKAYNVNNGNASATMLQVLMPAAKATASAGNALGIATVTSLLNAFSHANYPVSAAQIIAMFNAVSNGGTYMVGGVTPWDQSRVITYFQSLYV